MIRGVSFIVHQKRLTMQSYDTPKARFTFLHFFSNEFSCDSPRKYRLSLKNKKIFFIPKFSLLYPLSGHRELFNTSTITRHLFCHENPPNLLPLFQSYLSPHHYLFALYGRSEHILKGNLRQCHLSYGISSRRNMSILSRQCKGEVSVWISENICSSQEEGHRTTTQ